MASLTVRNIPEEAKLRFRQAAAAHGRSMEEHLRQMVIGARVDDETTFRGVSDVTQSFRHFEPVEPFVSSGSPVIDRLLKSWQGGPKVTVVRSEELLHIMQSRQQRRKIEQKIELLST